MKLDIGCGIRPAPGFVGIDRHVEADIVHNLEKSPWPLETGSVVEARAFHVIEHIQGIYEFMAEVYRVLEPGGLLHIDCPHYLSERAWQDPSHVRAITPLWFLYWDKDWRRQEAIVYFDPIDFVIVGGIGLVMNAAWFGKSSLEQEWAAQHCPNAVDDLRVVLKKR